jgi:hypothetical protein
MSAGVRFRDAKHVLALMVSATEPVPGEKRSDQRRVGLVRSRERCAGEAERSEAGRQAAQLLGETAGGCVPPVAGEPIQVDAVAEKAVEPPRGDDPSDIAISEAQLVVRRSERRSADARRRRTAVVEGPEEGQHVAVHDRDAALRVADAQIAGTEVLGGRRRREEKRRRTNEAYEERSHTAHIHRAAAGRFPPLRSYGSQPSANQR